jgi:hypothetical protein
MRKNKRKLYTRVLAPLCVKPFVVTDKMLARARAWLNRTHEVFVQQMKLVQK